MQPSFTFASARQPDLHARIAAREAEAGVRGVWLRVKTTGGRSLRGPVEVSANGESIAAGTFSLERRGLEESGMTFVLNWVSTPSGARGQVRLFVLPEVAPGTKMVATAHLRAGEGVEVSDLALQVRRGTAFGWKLLLFAGIGALSICVVLCVAIVLIVRALRRSAPDDET